MSIETTYREMLLEDEIRERLKQGEATSSSDLREIVEDLIENTDLSQPQFVAENYHVEVLENSSASKFNNTFGVIRQDIRALYKEMIELSLVSIDAYERWGIETESLEKKLVDLEERIENLLLLTQDTEGYFNFIVDNFTDSTMVDLDESTILVDPSSASVSLAPGTGDVTRLFLNDLDAKEDLSFRVRTTGDIINRTEEPGAKLKDIFSQTSRVWGTAIQTSKVKPLTCEIVVRLDPDEPVSISRILIDLHHSSQSSKVSITPLYSLDNYSYTQFATITPTQEVRTNALFTFPETECQWVKFILTKTGPDPGETEGVFSYQFGFKRIAFYRESFGISTAQTLISKPLWVPDEDGNPIAFEKLVVDACEKLEEGTEIKYYITTSNDSSVPIDDDTIWTPISPLNRENPVFPTLLTVGDIEQVVLGDNEEIKISYNTGVQVSGFSNPAQTFNMIGTDVQGNIETTEVTATATRYRFVNPEDFLLNYQVKSGLEINEKSLLVLRNLGEQGLYTNQGDYSVRGVQRGWAFNDPWYTCVIYIQNADGMSMDVGDKFIYINDVRYTGNIDKTVLTGETLTSTGIHRIRIHKDNWRHVEPQMESVAELKAADPLYPYNQKLLVEGYEYDDAYPDEEEKVYTGADYFAEMQMQKISIFDLLYNIEPDAIKYYAIDLDAQGTHSGDTVPSKVFVIKSSINEADFQNERFMVRFTLINQLRSYLRLRADFSTENELVAPILHSYKVKLG